MLKTPVLLIVVVVASAAPMRSVGPGVWRPLYPAEGEEAVAVPAFQLDERTVTTREFAAFVRANPTWQRGAVGALFADEGYLTGWASPTEPGEALHAKPVTQVSWWAARAYCSSRDARLPTEAEWELAGMASATTADATGDPAHLATILAWYSRPGRDGLPDAGSGPANVWGIRGLHTGVWEWVDDYASALVSVDNREDGAVDASRFCGAGAVSASIKEDYAAFMRIAFRSSLQAASTTANLGFRCARDAGPEPQP